MYMYIYILLSKVFQSNEFFLNLRLSLDISFGCSFTVSSI